jgi:soluble lytic murein transglycosylase
MYYARNFGHQVKALKQRLGIVSSRFGSEKVSE